MNPPSLGRRVFRIALTALVMQFVLSVAWLATLAILISQLTASNPELRKIYLQVQQQSNTLSNSNTDADRFFEAMTPIFVQLDWTTVTLITGILGFSLVGFAYGRLTGTTDSVAVLPALALLAGQNPVSLAMDFSDRGISLATLSFPQQVMLLASQMVVLLLSAGLGARLALKNRLQAPP